MNNKTLNVLNMVRKFVVDLLSFCRYFSENGDSTVGASILIEDFNKFVALDFTDLKDGIRFPTVYFKESYPM